MLINSWTSAWACFVLLSGSGYNEVTCIFLSLIRFCCRGWVLELDSFLWTHTKPSIMSTAVRLSGIVCYMLISNTYPVEQSYLITIGYLIFWEEFGVRMMRRTVSVNNINVVTPKLKNN
eukprot:TRINITY_DN6446_c0_g1_i3.p1 TRINITY_DN6446_c0_g1~~TRINITY_DN6446_c0_g1_i3.p1  ORF type:complete len:119 (-),score=14.26 TRINITY_DN6446_c0_g1_i3:16-372(-)